MLLSEDVVVPHFRGDGWARESSIGPAGIVGEGRGESIGSGFKVPALRWVVTNVYLLQNTEAQLHHSIQPFQLQKFKTFF